MRYLLLTLFCLSANGATIREQFPGFEVPCSGRVQGSPPFGCEIGETRELDHLGEVIAGYLKPSVDASWTPAPVPVYVQPVSPIASAVPEPGYVYAVGAALGLLILLRLIGIETDRGGK